MNKPDFYTLPYSIREHLVDQWEWDYDVYDDSSAQLKERILYYGPEGSYDSDLKQLDRHYANVTVEQLAELAAQQLPRLKGELGHMERFIAQCQT